MLSKEKVIKQKNDMEKKLARTCRLIKLLGWAICAVLLAAAIVLMKLSLDHKIPMLVGSLAVIFAFILILLTVKTASEKLTAVRKKGKEKADRLEDDNFRGFSLRG